MIASRGEDGPKGKIPLTAPGAGSMMEPRGRPI